MHCSYVRSKLLASALALTILPGVSDDAAAAPIAYDNFNSYTSGSNLNTQNGGSDWSAGWIAPVTTSTVQSGVIPDFGNSLRISANGNNAAERQFASQTGDVLYIGFLLRTNTSWDAANFFQAFANASTGETDTTGTSGGIRNNPNSPYFVRKGSGSDNANSTNSTLTHPNNVTQSLVLRFSKSISGAGNKYDEIALFVNQPLAGVPDASRGAAEQTNSATVATIDRIHFRTANLSAGDQVYIDELKVATTYGEAYTAVPEPTSLALFGLGGLGLLVLVRRRRA